MAANDELLALADELEGMDVREGCRTCPADGTKDCRGDLSCEEAVARAVARRVREIVEHDECEVTTVSAYDLLPEEDRYALAWIRKHGGLDMVVSRFESGEIAADMLWGRGHGRFWTTDDFEEEISKRLMPSDMEWPRYTDGLPVEVGDEVVGSDYGERISVDAVKFHANGFTLYDKNGFDKWYESDDRFERPSPKVVDADGVEIRMGDEVYIASCGDGPWTVTKITTAHAWHVYGHSDELGSLDMQPNLLTHRAPVLAGMCREIGMTPNEVLGFEAEGGGR